MIYPFRNLVDLIQNLTKILAKILNEQSQFIIILIFTKKREDQSGYLQQISLLNINYKLSLPNSFIINVLTK